MANQTAKQKIAERQRANAAAVSNLSALGQGVKSIPGRVVNYIKTTTYINTTSKIRTAIR